MGKYPMLFVLAIASGFGAAIIVDITGAVLTGHDVIE